MFPPAIEARIQYCPVTGHWYWSGSWDSGNGYPKVRWRGRIWTVSRLLWTFAHGPVPDGHHLDHLPHCRWRPCINVLGHLEPVTPQVNTLRGAAVLFQPRELSCPL